MPIEYEAKFLNIDKEEIRSKLSAAGFTCTMPETLYKRQVFDVPGFSSKEKWGRVRLEKDVINLSIKHTIDASRVDGTLEREINIPLGQNPVQQFEDAIRFMLECGLQPAGLHENKREIWQKDQVEVVIDTWPGVPPYIEIEAESEEQVRKACGELGMDFEWAKFGGILIVYEEGIGMAPEVFCALETVTFANPPVRI